MEEKHTIVFGNGVSRQFSLNGNNYISDEPIPDELLIDQNLVGMTIDGVEQFDTVCCNHFMDEEGDHVIFAVLSESEKKQRLLESIIRQQAADIDYCLMLLEE